MTRHLHFQVAGQGMFVGQFLIPPDTIVDTSNPNDPWRQVLAPIFERGLPPPSCAIPLNDETYQVMMVTYGAVPGLLMSGHPAAQAIVRRRRNDGTLTKEEK